MGGAIFFTLGAYPQLTDCRFVGNTTTYYDGGGIACYGQCSPSLLRCTLVGNTATRDGGAVYINGSSGPASVVLDSCTLANNAATRYGGGLCALYDGASATVSHSTLFGNRAPDGGGVACAYGDAALDHTIIAFGAGGEAVWCSGTGAASLTCCDLYGNLEGDWVGCIADQAGANGNFSADPIFCDPEFGSFALRSDSPCADAPGCGQVGALGVGCTYPNTWFVATTGDDVTGDGSAEHPFQTITRAYSPARALDTIEVAAGTYAEHDIPAESGICLRGATGQPEDVAIDANGSGRILSFSGADSTTRVQDLTLRNGQAAAGGAVECVESAPRIENCVFTSCVADSGGALACRGSASAPALSHCIFAGNTATVEGGAVYAGLAPSSFDGCTFYANGAQSGIGGAMALHCDAAAPIQHTIIAFTSGEAIHCGGTAAPALICSDIFSNAGSDWTGCIADQAGTNGNFRADPLFCDPATGDLRLHSSSPCADAPGCGQVGALGVGCVPQTFYVATWGSDATGDGTEGNPFATIAHAYTQAAAGDAIEVACGTYPEHDIDLKSGVTLRSATGLPECATIDAGGSGRIFATAYADSATRVDGFTLTGGFADNGGAVYCTGNARPRLTHCRLSGNRATSSGGAVCATGGAVPSLAYCTLSGDSAAVGGAIGCDGGAVALDHCTLYGNTAVLGSGLFCYMFGTSAVDHSIIAFGAGGEAVYCGWVGPPVMTCSDVYGNAGGDWVGCIQDQAGINGNLWADPLFCDTVAGEFTVRSYSPCADAPGCGLVGACGVGCDFRITSVTDVGNDQGREVRLRWDRSRYDATGMDPRVTSYTIFRRIDPGRRGSEAAPVRTYPPGEWDLIKTVPAFCEEQYSTLCPTLCDSTIAEGTCWSTFFVRAGTAEPSVYFDADPDSGYSVDNLAPGVPGNLHYAGPTVLAWDESGDADFDYFSVYGSSEEALDPETAELIAQTTGTSLDVSEHVFGYYHATATDFAGNEGGPASIEGQSQAVTDPPGLPGVYALHPCRPSPSRSSVTIRYDLPRPTPVRLQVVDAGGRVVRTLIDAAREEAGRRAAIWDGLDGRGHPLTGGIYFCRLEAGGFRATRSVLLLR